MSQKNVFKLSKSYVEKGFNQGFPLTVGILPLVGPCREVSPVNFLFPSEQSFAHEFVAGTSRCTARRSKCLLGEPSLEIGSLDIENLKLYHPREM